MYSNNSTNKASLTGIIPVSLEDFKLLRVLGKGHSGTVFLVEKIGGCDNGTKYAMKSIKKVVSKTKATCPLFLERDILVNSNHPFVTKIFYAFQTKERVYMVLEFHQAGDFFNRIISEDAISENDVRVYVAEIILALEHIHNRGIIYRDLKPENILIGIDGHLVLTDFGLCGLPGISKGLCGTIDFIPPEMFKKETQTIAVDWWTLGVFTHILMTGDTAFTGPDDRSTVQNILNYEPMFPDWLSKDATSLISGLLQKDPRQRLGSGGVEEIKDHSFFESIDWVRIAAKKGKIPFVPTFEGESDLCHFDSEITSRVPKESVNSNPEYETQEMFRDFEYVHPSVQEEKYFDLRW